MQNKENIVGVSGGTINGSVKRKKVNYKTIIILIIIIVATAAILRLGVLIFFNNLYRHLMVPIQPRVSLGSDATEENRHTFTLIRSSLQQRRTPTQTHRHTGRKSSSNSEAQSGGRGRKEKPRERKGLDCAFRVWCREAGLFLFLFLLFYSTTYKNRLKKQEAVRALKQTIKKSGSFLSAST